jgi:uncharacterized protein with FMN-binding domain
VFDDFPAARMITRSNVFRFAAIGGLATSLVVASGCVFSDGAARPSGPPGTRATRSSREFSDESAYADGVYSATGQYGSLPSSITVTMTLVGGVIRGVDVVPHAEDPTSFDFQRRFAAAVPAVVVGKRLDEVKMDRLAGSRGTPEGFNAALQRIKDQASRGRTGSE